VTEATYLWGYGNGPWGSAGRKTKAQILASAQFDHVDPELMRRLFALADFLISIGSDFGFGGGDREFAEQDAEFRRRHYVVETGGIWKYDGKRWARHSWAAPYAPPGNSWHEAKSGVDGGQAVDALGDHVLAAQHCARFGLVNGIAGEGWHYQCIELPHARKFGQVWGHLIQFPLPGEQPAPTPQPDEDDMELHDIPPRIFSTRPEDEAVVTAPPLPPGGGKLRIPVPFSDEVAQGQFQITVAPVNPSDPKTGFFRACRGALDPTDSKFKHSNGNYGAGIPESSPVMVALDDGEFMIYCNTETHVIVDWLAYDKVA
jgi:hypothetical protein